MVFSSQVIIIVFAILAIALCAVYFVISRKSETLKKGRRYAFILIPIAFVGLFFSVVNHVYILKDHKNYDEQVLLLPSKYKLSNGQEVGLSPKLGFYSVVINDTTKPAVFETVIYGKAAGKPDVALPAQAVTYVNSTTDYVLREPPNSVRIKGSGTTKGWIRF